MNFRGSDSKHPAVTDIYFFPQSYSMVFDLAKETSGILLYFWAHCWVSITDNKSQLSINYKNN